LLSKEDNDAGFVPTVFDGGPHTGENKPPF